MSANIVNVGGLDCYEENGVAYLNLEQAARGLGFTRIAASGNEVVRWERVNGYLRDFGFMPTSGHGDSQQVGEGVFDTRGERHAYIPENIFYRLAMKAKSEAAEKFQAWVADEVIPSIRKRGMYATGATVERFLNDPDFAIRLFSELKRERDEKQALSENNRVLQAKIADAAPKVLFADAVSVSDSAILIGELAKLLKQNGVADMGQNRLFAWLRENEYLIRRKGTDYNMPTQKSMELGLFRVKETAITHSDGHVTVSKTAKVTGKGQAYFINQFLKKAESPVDKQSASG